MDFIGSLTHLMDANTLLSSFGPWVLVGLGIIVFIESGLLFPFLPGDSLLVTAAILHGELNTNIWAIFAVAAVAAVAGDQAGFFIGHRFGRRFFSPDAKILKTEHLDAAEEFFAKHGPIALVLGRFVPIIRTYVPLAAGTSRMDYKRFVVWNVSGALAWVTTMILVGVLLGGIPGIEHSIEGIMLVIVGISVLPIIISGINKRRNNKKAAKEQAATDEALATRA